MTTITSGFSSKSTNSKCTELSQCESPLGFPYYDEGREEARLLSPLLVHYVVVVVRLSARAGVVFFTAVAGDSRPTPRTPSS